MNGLDVGCKFHFSPSFLKGKLHGLYTFSQPCRSCWLLRANCPFSLFLSTPRLSHFTYSHNTSLWVKWDRSRSPGQCLKRLETPNACFTLSFSQGRHLSPRWSLSVLTWDSLGEGLTWEKWNCSSYPFQWVYSWICAHLGRCSLLTGSWKLHKVILIHTLMLNQCFCDRTRAGTSYSKILLITPSHFYI